MQEVPEHVAEGLRSIREGLHLRWNPKGKLVKTGSYDSTGRLKDPVYDPRWELWDVDPQGAEYMVMRLQNTDGSFRPPGDWLVHHVNRLNPARYGGNVAAMLEELLEAPEALRELGTEKDTDDLFEAVGKWGEWCATPKSGAALTNRGKRLLSA